MSFIKRHMEDDEFKKTVALDTLLKAGVLRRCENHNEIILEGTGEVDDAIERGRIDYHSGILDKIFSDPLELKNMIKDVFIENSGDECSICVKNSDD